MCQNVVKISPKITLFLKFLVIKKERKCNRIFPPFLVFLGQQGAKFFHQKGHFHVIILAKKFV
jgi:hypothetical protein